MIIVHGFPAYRYEIDSRAADCREEMAVWATAAGHSWYRMTRSKPDVSWARNLIVADALLLRADILIMQDADSWMEEPYLPTLLRTMATTQAAVVSPVFMTRGEHSRPAVQPQRPGEVETIGAALLVIDLDQLRYMPQPWFKFTYDTSGSEVLEREDTHFCRAVKKYGCKIVADWTVPTCHRDEVLL